MSHRTKQGVAVSVDVVRNHYAAIRHTLQRKTRMFVKETARVPVRDLGCAIERMRTSLEQAVTVTDSRVNTQTNERDNKIHIILSPRHDPYPCSMLANTLL